MFRCYRGQSRAKAFERGVPPRSARERIKAKDFTLTGGKNGPILQNDVDEIGAFEMSRPHLLAGGAIKRDDRSFDADEYKI